jgi:integrase
MGPDEKDEGSIKADPLAELRRLLDERLPETKASPTIAELAERWLPIKTKGMASEPSFRGRFKNYICPPHMLGLHTSETLKPLHIEEWMEALEAHGLGPQTINHCRDGLRQLIEHAIINDMWPRRNPVLDTDKLEIPDHDVDILSLDEVPRMLSKLPPEFQPMFVLAVLLGPRRGEIFAIKTTPEHVDLKEGFIAFRGSHERLVTKNGKKRAGIPIPDELTPFLQKALRDTRGEYLFTTPDGKQWSRNTKVLNKLLRRALTQAGVTKRMTFHDLRHTSSTLHQEAHCHPWVVSKVLGHSQRGLAIFGNVGENMTAKRYTHFGADFVRQEINKLKIFAAADRQQPDERHQQTESNLRASSSVGQSISLLSQRLEGTEPGGVRPPLPASANFSGRRGASLEQRFWSKVRKGSGCWEWIGFRQPDGYGVIKEKRRKLLAHRVAWELERGTLLPGFIVCHKCDNSSCVRPSHLFAATDWANQRDKTNKGRQAIGERNGRAKLTPEAVLEIRRLHARGTSLTNLAMAFGVSRRAIRFVVDGDSWKHLLELL